MGVAQKHEVAELVAMLFSSLALLAVAMLLPSRIASVVITLVLCALVVFGPERRDRNG